MADTISIRPTASATLSAVTLGTGSETTYALIGTFQVLQPGLITLQGDVGSGNALGGLKLSRAAVPGGTAVALVSDASIDTANVSRGVVDVIGDGTHGLYQTALSSSFQISFLWLGGPGDLLVYAKRADSGATTTLTLSASMGPVPPEAPAPSGVSTSGNASVGGTLAVTGAATCASTLVVTGTTSGPRVEATVAAAGTDQSTAAALTGGGAVNVVTGADATKGVKLPTAAAGDVAWVVNVTAATLKVWPFSGDAIDAASSDANVTLVSGERAGFFAKDATTWYSLVGVVA